MTMVGAAKHSLRALVIGAGPAATAMHLPVLGRLRDQGRMTLTLVCDLREERAGAARKEFGFQEQTSDGLAALARADVDLVYIFGDARLHYEYGLAALRNGKHLFVEKPIAPTYLQARELAQLAQSAGRVAVGGHNRRFLPSLLRVRGAAGHGGWRFAEAVFHKPEAGTPPPFGAKTWLSANGIHALDALVYVMGGLPARVSAVATSPRATQPSTFSAVMSWEDGRQGTFLCDNDAGLRREEYAFHSVAQSYCVGDAGLSIASAGRVTEFVPLPAVGAGIEEEHAAFLDAVKGQANAPHDIAAIAPSLLLAELIEAGFNGEVRLPDSEPPANAPAQAASRVRQGARDVPRSVLVSRADGLEDTLLRHLPGVRLVALAEVRDGEAVRPDIGAAILGRGAEALKPEVLAKLPRLAIIGVAGLSLTAMQPAALLARNITVVNAAEAYAQSLAEFALGLAVLGRRRGFTSHELMRLGGWGTNLPPAGLRGLVRRIARRGRPMAAALGVEEQLLRWWRAGTPSVTGSYTPHPRLLRGATVGLIGWGSSARAFAVRLLQAEARVLVFSEHAPESELRHAGVVLAALGDVLAAEIVSLHRGLTPATRHFLGAAELARLRPGALLINVARGALIEPAALVARLRRGDVFACLDTYEEEPLASTNALRALPNVFLTAHIGGGSADMHAAAADEVVGKIAAFMRGEEIQTVTDERLATMT
jgi:phosphoglycerate dehydrogenase-like enzyme/predicted dehydrogenase